MKVLENGIFEENYTTSFTHCGINGIFTNKSFLLLMENIAGMHSNYYHITFTDLAKENLTWIIVNWRLKVFKRLGPDQKVKIHTWVQSSNRVSMIRNFKFYNDKEELCAIASSKWCLFNFKTGRISPIPENIESIFGEFNNETVFEDTDIPKLSVPPFEYLDSDTYKIRRFDLDNNRHVHNLNYLNFAYEVLPEDVYLGPEFNNLEIAYKREIRYGETIKTFIYENEENNGYTIVIKSLDEKTIHSILKLY